MEKIYLICGVRGLGSKDPSTLAFARTFEVLTSKAMAKARIKWFWKRTHPGLDFWVEEG